MQRKKILEPVVDFICKNATEFSSVTYEQILQEIPITLKALSKATRKIKTRFASKIRVEKNPLDARKVFFFLASPDGENSGRKEGEIREKLGRKEGEKNKATENGEIASKSLPGATLDPSTELEEKNLGHINTLNNISQVFSSAKNLEGDSKEKVEDQNLMTSPNPFMSSLGEEHLKALNEMETPETPSSDKASLLISHGDSVQRYSLSKTAYVH